MVGRLECRVGIEIGAIGSTVGMKRLIGLGVLLRFYSQFCCLLLLGTLDLVMLLFPEL